MTKSIFILFLLMLAIPGCGNNISSSSQMIHVQTDSLAVPDFPARFIHHDYIELEKISRISKFRSGIGHEYRDEAESCRNMKHYYQPISNVDWSAIKIFSPVNGTVSRVFNEWAGTQIQITPFDHPEYTIILFHVAAEKTPAIGDTVTAGSQLGSHIGPQTMSDIAVGYSGQGRWKLISYFEIMSDTLFSRYQSRGAVERKDFLISKEQRDADPLNCSGTQFGNAGTLDNWVLLR